MVCKRVIDVAMIPVVLILVSKWCLPENIIEKVPTMNPYLGLIISYALAYFGFGWILLKKFGVVGTGGNADNNNPRAGTKEMAEADPQVERCNACHQNCLEGFAFLVGSVLCALQAGVDIDIVGSFMTLNVICRTLYVLIYCFANNGNIRTLVWLPIILSQAKLFYMAWDASTASGGGVSDS